MEIDNLKYEKELYKKGITLIAGVDEVGRGPIVGPVVAAAVILPVNYHLDGLTDSKKVSEKKRKILSAVFSNFFLNGSKLSYDIKKPFEIFLKRSNRLLNWAWRDSNSHAFALVPKTSVSTIPPHAHGTNLIYQDQNCLSRISSL